MILRILLFVLLGSLGALHAQEAGPSLNDQAKFLAGLPVRDSALDRFAHERTWVDHATAMDAAFTKQYTRQLNKVRDWARLNVPNSGDNGEVELRQIGVHT